MKEYIIFNFQDKINESIVFMNTVEDMYYFIDDIYEEISKVKGTKFSVIIDLFLRNGFSFNRFVMFQFHGKEKYNTFIINSYDVSDNAKRQIRQYLKVNNKILEESALDSKTIEFVRR